MTNEQKLEERLLQLEKQTSALRDGLWETLAALIEHEDLKTAKGRLDEVSRDFQRGADAWPK